MSVHMYPIDHIGNIQKGSIGGDLKICFLTAGNNGILPPIYKFDNSQAMYHFISGYTFKVAGTEMGITEPKLVFSAGFGELKMLIIQIRCGDMPSKVPGVASGLFNSRNTREHKEVYDVQAKELAIAVIKKIEKYEEGSD